MKDTQEIAATIGSLPQVLEAMLVPIDQACLAVRPEPGEWSVLEVVGHLVATDAGGFRDRIQAIVDGEPDIAPFDAWEAINERDFKTLNLAGLLAELTDQRIKSVQFLTGLDRSCLAKTSRYGHLSNGEARYFAAGDFVHEWPFHDQDHIQQILDILKANYLPHMTETMRNALAADDG